MFSLAVNTQMISSTPLLLSNLLLIKLTVINAAIVCNSSKERKTQSIQESMVIKISASRFWLQDLPFLGNVEFGFHIATGRQIIHSSLCLV